MPSKLAECSIVLLSCPEDLVADPSAEPMAYRIDEIRECIAPDSLHHQTIGTLDLPAFLIAVLLPFLLLFLFPFPIWHP